MAIWNQHQRIRLATEEVILRQELPGFAFYDRTSPSDATVRGAYRSSAGTDYELAVRLSPGFPAAMPTLYVIKPWPLYDRDKKQLVKYGLSHAMHIWESDWNGYVKICHCKSDYWTASRTIAQVVLKGFLWLEAYERHLKTGKSIDAYSLTYR